MFATLIGAFPEPGAAEAGEERANAVNAVIAELAAAGLEPVSDGRGGRDVRNDADVAAVVEAWRSASAATPLAVKQTLIGPFTLEAKDVRSAADPIRTAIEALAAAGCPMIEIEEPEAFRIGDDAAQRRQFADGLLALTDGLGDRIHLSLALTGGNVDRLGAAVIYEPSFSSYAFDLIAGPDNWRLIAQAPRDRGIVVGALGAAASADDRPELLVWAASYAASLGARGPVRVGLANSSSLAGLSWERAGAKVRALGAAARLAGSRSPEELAAGLDPRAINIRSAAAGRFMPRKPSGLRPPKDPGRPRT